MKSVCVVYNVPFQDLLEAVEQACEDTSKGGHAVICRPPYNTRRSAELSDSEYDEINRQDMSHFSEFISALMNLGPHGHMFYFALRFKA